MLRARFQSAFQERIAGRNSIRACTLAIVSAAALPAHAGGWNQFYIGGGLGADAATTDIDVSSPGGDAVGINGLGGGDIGATIRAGADLQINQSLVVGAFANYDWSNIESKGSLWAGDDLGNSERYAAKILGVQYAWAIGGRIGLVVSPATLAYGLLGYTQVAFDDPSLTGELRISGKLVDSQGARINLPKFDGIVFGAGFEHQLTDHVSIWAEYRQARLGEIYLAIPSTDSIGSIDPTLHTGRIGVSYRFGGADSAKSDDGETLAPVWTGVYFGGSFGADGVTGDLKATHTADTGFVDTQASASGIGGGDIGGGLTVGYDAALSNSIIAGVFGSYDRSASDISISGSSGGQSVSVNLPSIGNMWMIGGRAGTLLAPDVLAYGLVAYSHLDFSDVSGTDGTTVVSVKSKSFNGVVVGGGLEKAVTANLFLRGEYRYAMLGQETIYNSNDNDGVIASSEPNIHSLRVMATYRFNGPN